jgi:predicted secreted Zn-dependent protease
MAGRTKGRRVAAAIRQREERSQDGAGVDPRRTLLALRATHGAAKVLRAQAIRELSRQHGNYFVQRSLAPNLGAQVTASPAVIAREATEEEAPVKVTDAPANATYAVTGTTLAQAFQSIQAYASAHDGEAGSVKWRPTWTMTKDDDGYVKSVSVTARIVKTMPRWLGADKLSAAAKAEWNRVYKELDDHENRHLDILKNGATYIGNSALGAKMKEAAAAANAAKDSINADNTSIDPFETVMTTDIT